MPHLKACVCSTQDLLEGPHLAAVMRMVRNGNVESEFSNPNLLQFVYDRGFNFLLPSDSHEVADILQPQKPLRIPANRALAQSKALRGAWKTLPIARLRTEEVID